MEIRVLGCHGSQLPGCGLTGFLIDAKILLDAGAVTSVLTLDEQAGISHILITHSHMDHIRELASLADNLCYLNRGYPLTVIAPSHVIDTLRAHIFNNIIWPDFSLIPSPDEPIMRFVAIRIGEKVHLGHLDVTAIPVNHTVETVAYIVEAIQDKRPTAAVFVGDTGPTDKIWREARRGKNIRAVFVETSLPEEMLDIARLSGHLTPAGLAGELTKLGPLGLPIYLYHMKIQYRTEIQRQIALMENSFIHVLQDGQVIQV